MAHVFVSYVHENRNEVDRLVGKLREVGIPVWLDASDIEPGVRWRDAIRTAIQSGSFFMACFSKEYKEREKTHMNEELTLAIEELRERPSDKAWFIPVLINETEIPSRRISSVEDLRDIQAIKLYENWDEEVYRIVNAVKYGDLELEDELYRLAENGDAKSQMALGDMYAQRGAREPERSTKQIEYMKKGIDWYNRAYKQGALEPDTLFGVACLLEYCNDNNGYELWIRRAADAGFAVAQRMIGATCWEREDYEQARIWLQRAALQGELDALNLLGLLYVMGKGVVTDSAMAEELWSIAAEAGHTGAKENLGRLRV